jgi:hypothetical protein
MQFEGTLLLRRGDIEGLLSPRDCMAAVENVFRLQGQGKILAPGILGVKPQAVACMLKPDCCRAKRTTLLQN